jgi:hypothetical protein
MGSDILETLRYTYTVVVYGLRRNPIITGKRSLNIQMPQVNIPTQAIVKHIDEVKTPKR